jgi:hypothetical protein
LTYPVKYHDIGYREDIRDKEEDARSTGFQVNNAKASRSIFFSYEIFAYFNFELLPSFSIVSISMTQLDAIRTKISLYNN